ncbi:hypothetical protein MUK42_01025 [Musa troglodytarum]|uniref:Uncharacterized protein n=1 Tax=Musa troglodytarum TaxID=320322 RepID=A0A9E7JTC5_9LILI|nr:hypothetical protein MUK42_01025 [Musa troglodytarum]
MRRNAKLKKLMKARCKRKGIISNALAFLFEAEKVNRNQTPNEVCTQNCLWLLQMLACLAAFAAVLTVYGVLSWDWKIMQKSMAWHTKLVAEQID